MGRLILAKDWSSTPLGPLEAWPQSLKIALSLVLNSQHPMWLGWGPECTFLYNDAYLQVLGAAKHPWALGRPAAEVWAEIWDVCGPLAEKVFKDGEASFVDNVRLFMKRAQYVEETFYSFSYSPIFDEAGHVAGLFCPSNEITDRLLTERRLKTLSELSARAYLERTTDAACLTAITTIAKNPADIPFALLYLTDPGKPTVTLKGSVGVNRDDTVVSPVQVDVAHPGSCAWPMDMVLGQAASRVVPVRDLASLPIGLSQQKLAEALVLPVAAAGQEHPVGVLVVGVSPARQLDREYRTFFELVAGQVGTAILSARSSEEEKRRAEELAKLDKAKTAFFSNVSHEFRTPLTLLLGPLEEALRSKDRALSGEPLDAAYRNAVRLLKLVNSLLDFSRFEAGRMEARFERSDLGRMTRDLASIFRSAVERAGLRYTVESPDLAADVYVDPALWEKIVLNLLSNALKFTFEGGITVRLGANSDKVVLEVADTGTGIPEAEIPRIFERFHRVQGARSRSQEGSGIGMALVQELVRMHGGTIGVESVLEKGTTFRVELPMGRAHLITGVVERPGAREGPPLGSAAFLGEALSWSKEAAAPAPAPTAGARILLADDNPDMREYIQRLLKGRWTVEAVPDGVEALTRARSNPPDLILSDVMMPRLDGFGLLKALRSDEQTKSIPVILLSARAGEDSRIEGLDWGADDYLVKPFSAQELVARVGSHLKLHALRKESQELLLTALDAARMFAWEWDLESGKATSSPTIREIAGIGTEVRVEEALGGVHPEDLPRLQAAIDQAVRRGGNFLETVRFKHAVRGEWVHIEAHGRVRTDASGQARCMVGIAHDVTKLKRVESEIRQLNASLELKVEERTARLSEALRELETFASSVAHDLRGPLRAMVQLSEILVEEYASGLASEGQDYARRIAAAALRMDHLTSDLLEYSRLARADVALKPLSLDFLMGELLSGLEPEITSKGATVESALQGVVLVANPFLLGQALTNLLANALKFTRPGVPARVRLHAERRGARVRIWIEDNGIGIDPAHRPRLFRVFERLNPAGPYPGTGIGLAIARKAVERMNGAIDVESEVGQGSRFWIELPAPNHP